MLTSCDFLPVFLSCAHKIVSPVNISLNIQFSFHAHKVSIRVQTFAKRHEDGQFSQATKNRGENFTFRA